MDNQSALLADWDLPVLKDTLEQLDTGAFDMGKTGFSAEEIEELMTQYYAPASLDDLLQELDMSKAIEKPVWAVIRTTGENQERVEQALSQIESSGIRVERSYEV